MPCLREEEGQAAWAPRRPRRWRTSFHFMRTQLRRLSPCIRFQRRRTLKWQPQHHPSLIWCMHMYLWKWKVATPTPQTHIFSLPPLTRRWQECQSLARDCSSQSFFLSLASSPWCREIMSTGRRFASESDRQTDRQTSGRTDNDSLIGVSCSRGWYFHCVCRQQLCNKCSEKWEARCTKVLTAGQKNDKRSLTVLNLFRIDRRRD